VILIGVFLLIGALAAQSQTVALILLIAALFCLWAGFYLTFEW